MRGEDIEANVSEKGGMGSDISDVNIGCEYCKVRDKGMAFKMLL